MSTTNTGEPHIHFSFKVPSPTSHAGNTFHVFGSGNSARPDRPGRHFATLDDAIAYRDAVLAGQPFDRGAIKARIIAALSQRDDPVRTRGAHDADIDRERRTFADEYLTWARLPRATSARAWGQLACDIYDEAHHMIIEAKSKATSASFHMGVGELLDYSDQDGMDGATLWIVTIDEPKPRLKAYALKRNIYCIWRQGRQFVSNYPA